MTGRPASGADGLALDLARLREFHAVEASKGLAVLTERAREDEGAEYALRCLKSSASRMVAVAMARGADGSEAIGTAHDAILRLAEDLGLMLPPGQREAFLSRKEPYVDYALAVGRGDLLQGSKYEVAIDVGISVVDMAIASGIPASVLPHGENEETFRRFLRRAAALRAMDALAGVPAYVRAAWHVRWNDSESYVKVANSKEIPEIMEGKMEREIADGISADAVAFAAEMGWSAV